MGNKKDPGGVALEPLEDPMRDPRDEEILVALAARSVPTMARTLMLDLKLNHVFNPLIRTNGKAVNRMRPLLTAGTVEKATPTTYRLTDKGRAAVTAHLRATTGPLTPMSAVTEAELVDQLRELSGISPAFLSNDAQRRFLTTAQGLLERYTITPRS
jgi:DNA-binding transcriptional ArsR family regulator